MAVLVDIDGEHHALGRFDSVVVATSNQSFDPLSSELHGAHFSVQVVGDAEKPGSIFDAVSAGHRAAMAV